eukprot:TRINITY_DN8178_c0_g1_i1.p1 TRINITY_DN8178_c0_g1~~TRINITY_DN8178_c0_g1_i1.p1  ORF type:complete len:244 (+),score=49.69 TRINITY_DN8178_c0_g1_i1:64-732(+)
MAKLIMYYDCISPYAMIMYSNLLRHGREWNDVKMAFKPVLLAGVMQMSGNTPPGMNKAKAAYMGADLKMNSEMSGVKLLRMPKNFFDVAKDMRPQRMLSSIERTETEQIQREAIRLTFAAIHSNPENRDGPNFIFPPTLLEDICKAAEVSNIPRTLSSIETDDVKNHLKENTAEAVGLGMFGAPFIHATNSAGATHSFFGSDRLEHLCAFIGKPYHGMGHKL